MEIHGGFWNARQRLNAEVIIPHCEAWVDQMGWVANFDAAIEGRLPRDRRGREFSDSDVYKLLEAMAWQIARGVDRDMERRFDMIVRRVAAAQEADGYVNTMFGRPGQADRYSDPEWGHELYCFGHLIQAGVARARTRGEDLLFRIAKRAADHVCDAFGPTGSQVIDGHPQIEVALAELGRYTGDHKYIEQARLFVERRGHGLLGAIDFGAAYFQDDEPFVKSTVLRGHAVRALYLAAGATDIAVETNDEQLLSAVQRQTTNTLARRTYVTGGMGAHHEGESFGLDYELPPDRAYSETCAGVGSLMLSYRLLLATGASTYGDVVERTLYNVIAGAPAEDGKSFFYTNPLHQRVSGDEPDRHSPSPRAATSLRAPWFEVSCCPTNVARTLASLEAYVATTDEGGLQIHQYADATIRTALATGQSVALRMETEYPFDGRVRLTILERAQQPWTLALRVPSWAVGATVVAGGKERTAQPGGWATVTALFEVGDVVELRLPMRARWTTALPHIDATRGCVAVERGPLVMCLESTDLGCDVERARVAVDAAPVDREGAVLVPISINNGDAPDAEAANAWPYPSGVTHDQPLSPPRLVPLVPYFSRGNRGAATMRVWMPMARGRGLAQ